MSGPPPTPTALRIMRGNPGKSRINRNEPRPGPLPLDAPAVLDDYPNARAEWDRVAPGLIASGQVTIVDRAVLVAYCLKWAQWLALEREGLPRRGDANKTLTLMLRAAAELGMTPAGRSRVSVSPGAMTPPSGQSWADVLK